jgi:Ca2+-transporting ATPase
MEIGVTKEIKSAPHSPLNALANPHAVSTQDVLDALESSTHGLTQSEVAARARQYGKNELPRAEPPSVFKVFSHQFASPLVYVLVVAALLSIYIQEWSDAIFITAVLLINALIGTFQEYSAQQAAQALQQLVTSKSNVLRDGELYEINTENLVPGDIVLVESGDKVPADIRLLSSHDLVVDESLLTGESLPVTKDGTPVLDEKVVLGDRVNMLFTGTLVGRGRGRGIVVQTAMNTVLGTIAADVLQAKAPKAPLQIRMEIFTRRVALVVGLAAIAMFAVAVIRGTPLGEMFLLAVALAVSVIPEGLPVALTVALAIGMKRMATRNVIVRRLLAVEALGSCTYIVTDKTGTLTVNQLTVRHIAIPDQELWQVTGEGSSPDGSIVTPQGTPTVAERAILERFCHVAVLSNEGFFGRSEQGWTHHGDAVDVAMLVMAHKVGIVREEAVSTFPELDTIPYESETRFSASLNLVNDEEQVSVKGAVEDLLPMCSTMAKPQGDVAVDTDIVNNQVTRLAAMGCRVLALASGTIERKRDERLSEHHLNGLTLIGLVGIIDPLRPEVKSAILECHDAEIKVAMVTGDHPATAYAIAKELDLVDSYEQVVTGTELKQAIEEESLDSITSQTSVYARATPHQKLDIVRSLQRSGHFVAVSGDGANDAPALSVAQVGVAMGKTGTDVARESAELIITDDNFSSIVAGIEEGRVAYANVRKVIFLLISTGAAELVLFILALLTGLPLPLVAVQLLWLNLVTNGIQDVALAFEPAEGNVLHRPPRSPKEAIFNRLMIERVIVSALVIGTVAFTAFRWFLELGFTVDEARNSTLLLMVLFENVHVFNSRSETLSAFRHNPLRNPILLVGTAIAQLIHIGAMYTPWISDVLRVQPVTAQHWAMLFVCALVVLVVMEIHKLVRNKLL